jgi:hypothetical protein
MRIWCVSEVNRLNIFFGQFRLPYIFIIKLTEPIGFYVITGRLHSCAISVINLSKTLIWYIFQTILEAEIPINFVLEHSTTLLQNIQLPVICIFCKIRKKIEKILKFIKEWKYWDGWFEEICFFELLVSNHFSPVVFIRLLCVNYLTKFLTLI